MPNRTLGPSGKTSPLEEDKLIEEMQRLIKDKGLDVELRDKRAADRKKVLNDAKSDPVIMACPSCIACTCTICW